MPDRLQQPLPTRGFSLVELLAVMTVIALLALLLGPAGARAMERAKVAKVYGELRQIEVGLFLYHTDHQRYPPAAVSCNTAEREHWCELPRELVTAGYLPGGTRPGMSSFMQDPFNPGHTYKYATPGPYYLNGELQADGYAVYVPDDFPLCQSASGRYHDSVQSPLAWVIWSLGPRQQLTKALNSRSPVSGQTWYRATGDHGVIARIGQREASSFQTP